MKDALSKIQDQVALIEENARKIGMEIGELRHHDMNLYVNTHYGDEIFATMGEGWQQFPIVQRNLLIVIARNYVDNPIDGDNETPFATNTQTTAELPHFKGPASFDQIAKVLDALVAKMRRKEAKAA